MDKKKGSLGLLRGLLRLTCAIMDQFWGSQGKDLPVVLFHRFYPDDQTLDHHHA